ncbi:hypothetical protein BU251_07265 [Candidatus Velamenicoccus archaeovorus]|uniref:Uncharacterized protein n=1 Tax=Velamenicoccus archaeovorus TaxID=1930593 RepID=A0A410P5R0_VELA1|nr:hypothetical protein [Candidatus Velamenicoccus archaeovorus]QAT17527.1 hypothetical protein BU251_07265 [Candidatus Velamenicoccus archaeovorus]
MKIYFHSERFQLGGWPQRVAAFFIMLGGLAFLAGGLLLVALLVRWAFAQGIFFGFVFLFLVFPLIGRFLFFLFLIGLPAFLSWFFSLGSPKREPKDDDVIDVPHKIVK